VSRTRCWRWAAQGGLLDAQDDLSAGPIALITNPALSANNPDNPSRTAGTTFFGQFVDHDITFDTSSTLAACPATHIRLTSLAPMKGEVDARRRGSREEDLREKPIP